MAPTVKHLEQTLADLKGIDAAEARNIMTNYEAFIADFQRVVRARSVGSLVDKAELYYVNEEQILEMNLLFSAYCKIKENNLSNEDLRAARLTDYTSGHTPLTREAVERRLAALGWKG